MDPQLVQNWGMTSYFSNLPKIVCLSNNTFEKFSEKVDEIRGIKLDEYYEIIVDGSYKSMRPATQPYPHQIIKQRLERYLLTSQIGSS